MQENSQSQKFKDLAREVEADEDEAEFDAKLRKMRERREKPDEKPCDE